MKAVLVIDMPENCWDCEVHSHLTCTKLMKAISVKGKLKDCPLKPLPQKREPNEEWFNEYHRDDFADGWNACLDEIAGETE